MKVLPGKSAWQFYPVFSCFYDGDAMHLLFPKYFCNKEKRKARSSDIKLPTLWQAVDCISVQSDPLLS